MIRELTRLSKFAWLLLGALPAFAQPEAVRQLPSCGGGASRQRDISSRFGLVRFSIPKKLSWEKVADADYVAYRIGCHSSHGQRCLNFMFGGAIGDAKPDRLEDNRIKWSARKWKCDENVTDREWVGIDQYGHKSRFVKLPFGFAAYHGVGSETAAAFDEVLDHMCCGKCSTCPHPGTRESPDSNSRY
jgi:hypothetical protein